MVESSITHLALYHHGVYKELWRRQDCHSTSKVTHSHQNILLISEKNTQFQGTEHIISPRTTKCQHGDNMALMEHTGFCGYLST